MDQPKLDRLHQDLGLKRLNPLWAKLEIVGGLIVVGVALLLGAFVVKADTFAPERAAAAVALFMLGGYLAMAGSRSHLYQSANLLAAYLAEQVRSQSPRS